MPLATRRDIGQYLIGSLPGRSIPAELRSLAREFDLGGVILFSRNIEAPEQVAELSADSEALGRTAPAWVSVDQEGGRVARLKEPFTKWPPMATLGRAGKASEALAERFAKRWPRSCWPLASRSITRRCSTSTPIPKTPSLAIGPRRAR
jgi:beta-N-acetylhexosaminidase